MRTWVFCVIDFWKEWHFPPCFFVYLDLHLHASRGNYEYNPATSKALTYQRVRWCVNSVQRLPRSDRSWFCARKSCDNSLMCVLQKQWKKERRWLEKKKMFKQAWIYAERERGERIFSQRASLKVNVRSDRNKKEERVMQMKGGTRYRQQAGTNLSAAGNSFP